MPALGFEPFPPAALAASVADRFLEVAMRFASRPAVADAEKVLFAAAVEVDRIGWLVLERGSRERLAAHQARLADLGLDARCESGGVARADGQVDGGECDGKEGTERGYTVTD